MRDDLNLAIANLGDLDIVAEIADTTIDFDAVVQEFLVGGDIKDLVIGRLSGVDYELCRVQNFQYHDLVEVTIVLLYVLIVPFG